MCPVFVEGYRGMGWEDKTDDTGRSCACSGRASREVGRKEVGVEGSLVRVSLD